MPNTELLYQGIIGFFVGLGLYLGATFVLEPQIIQTDMWGRTYHYPLIEIIYTKGFL